MIRRVLLLTLLAIACTEALFGQNCPSGVSWCSGTYAYDGMGNIGAMGADTYVYDTAGRLVSGTADVQRTGIMSRQDYSYDTFGNRTAASRIAGSVNCPGGCEFSPTIDPLTNHITGSGAMYDDAGNLQFIQGPPDATYTYDAAGSLVHAVAGTDDRQFLYTADDERIATANGANGATWTWTVRGLDGKVLREFTSSQAPGGLPTSNWQWTKDYVWRDGLLLASVTPTTSGGTATQHFHLDHLGTPRLVTGDNGVQLSVHAYYPFGAELNLTSTEQPAELMKFTGHERDLLANDAHTLDYMHARYEMGTLGRFLSIDPVLDMKQAVARPQMWNRYGYVTNNPVMKTDPDGRVENVQQPGFTKPLSEANDWAEHPAVSWAFYAEGALLPAATAEFLGVGELYGTFRGFIRLVRGAREEPTIRPDVKVWGGRSGQDVKTTTGPPDSIIRGSDGRVYQTNDKGQIIADITKDRVKPVTPGQGFGPKRAPTEQELSWLGKMARAIRDLAK